MRRDHAGRARRFVMAPFSRRRRGGESLLKFQVFSGMLRGLGKNFGRRKSPVSSEDSRANPESLWPGSFHAESPLPDSRVDFDAAPSGYANSGFAIGKERIVPPWKIGELSY